MIDILEAAKDENGRVRFQHGTDAKSGDSLLSFRLNRDKAREFGDDGDFWATLLPRNAAFFAIANPANGDPVIFSFELPLQLVADLMGRSPPLVILDDVTIQAFRFSHDGFEIVNGAMTDLRVDELDTFV
jgi:hypothetical protein